MLVAAAIFLGCMFRPPALMDDVDATQAQSRAICWCRAIGLPRIWMAMSTSKSRHWKYWMIAVSFRLFQRSTIGRATPHCPDDSAAVLADGENRLWAFSARAGLYAGLALATCIGLFLFTRIPDSGRAAFTFTITLAMWSFFAPARTGRIASQALGAG